MNVESSAEDSGSWTRLAFGGVVALHVALVGYFARPSVMFGGHPISTYDYALHAYQVDRAVSAWRGWEKLWAYDPLVLAGQPAGAIEDLTSKSLELFVIALTSLGVSAATAFNGYVLLVHVLVPFAGWAAARTLGLDRRAAVLASLFWVLLWFFDSFMHWCWYIGMVSWGAAAMLTVLVVGSMFRAMESRKTRHFIILAVTAATLTLVHPFGVLTVVIPCAAMYARDFRRLGRREHALLWVGAALAGATTLVWIVPALQFRHYIGDTDVFLRPKAEHLLLDTLDVWKDVLNTGEPMRTMIRTVCLVTAFVGLWRWGRGDDCRTLPVALFVLVGVGVAYLGAYSWTARQTQPYRQIAPAMTMAAIVAAAVLARALERARLREIDRDLRLVLVLLSALAVPRFVKTVLVFMPGIAPAPEDPPRPSTMTAGLEHREERLSEEKRHRGPDPDYFEIRAWLLRHHEGRGRVLVANWVLAEWLAATTDLPLLGGILERNVPHADANFFRKELGTDPHRVIDEYLERYAVGWVVTLGPFGPLDHHRRALVPQIGIGKHRIYRTARDPRFIARGEGRLEAQELNRLKVTGAHGGEVVLRFHWMETLACRPSCAIRRVPVPGDRVGFIGVPDAPSDFEIYNTYAFR